MWTQWIKKNDEKLQQWAWVLLVNSLNAEANYEWERNRQKNNTGKQNLYHSPVFLENSHRSRCRYDACVNKIKRKVRITTVSDPVRWENRWNWQRDELCVLLLLRYSYCYSEMWQIVELKVTFDSATQHCRFPLAASHHLCFLSFFSSFPLRIYYADRHTLWICSASLVKQGSDWMMPGCRSSALLKSIFPAAALALASVLLSLDGFLFLSFLTRLTSWTSLAGCL